MYLYNKYGGGGGQEESAQSRERRRLLGVLEEFFPPGAAVSDEEGFADASREKRLMEVTQRLQVAREKQVQCECVSESIWVCAPECGVLEMHRCA